LHKIAQSGQLQHKSISLGDGKSPLPFAVKKFASTLGNLPSMSSSIDSILPKH